ncbi:MAG: type II toxin-antitoxin system Phd/YefM family antitoxin [Candidatus Caccosoma sp.]|nr:type II toxin-antitoxin system Phd/YefM family antitoxin [Candidatus Caccosoma sp.]
MISVENIRPSAELRNKYNEISNLCKETREPVYITVNGHGDTVILSLEQFNQIQAELELLKMLSESEDDVRNNRVKPVADTFNDIRKKLEL